MAVARRLGSFAYGQADILAFEHKDLTATFIMEIWSVIESTFPSSKRIDKDALVSRGIVAVADAFGIPDREVLGKRSLGAAVKYRPSRRAVSLVPEFVDAVDRLLPEQPWQIGVHLEVARTLNCAHEDVSAAIGQLMDSGRRKRQKNGVVYDGAGGVVAVDERRAHKSG
jgi:hypothetical protein